MNHIYKVIFNKATGTFMAVAEFAKAQGKKSNKTATHPSGGKFTTLSVLSVAVLTAALPNVAGAVDAVNPNLSGRLAAGRVQINGTNTLVPQNSSSSGGIAVGKDSSANNSQGVAFGSDAHATGTQSTAVGNNVYARADAAIAIGSDDINQYIDESGAKFKEHTGITLVKGSGSQNYLPTDAKGKGSIAIGGQAVANSNASVAIGVRSEASGFGGMAIGPGAKAGGNGEGLDTAFGTGAQATGGRSVALGLGANATAQNSVALGTGSIASDSANIPTDIITVGSGADAIKIDPKGWAGTKAQEVIGAVSVGRKSAGDSAAQYRQIHNVAAGRVASDSTDAINGSQLYGMSLSISNATRSGVPVVYTKADGTPIYKVQGKFYETPDPNLDAQKGAVTQEVPSSQVQARMAEQLNIANLKNNITAPAPNASSASKPTALTGDTLNNAATVGDVLNTGWNLAITPTKDGNAKAVGFIKPYDKVTFKAGDNVTLSNDGNEITINATGGGTTAAPITAGANLTKNGNEIRLKDEVTLGAAQGEKMTLNKGDITFTGTNGNKSQLGADGLKFADANNATRANTARITDTTIGFAKTDGTIDDSKPKITADNIDAGNTKILRVAKGTSGTDAVNVNQLKSLATVMGKGVTFNESGTSAGTFTAPAATPNNADNKGGFAGTGATTITGALTAIQQNANGKLSSFTVGADGANGGTQTAPIDQTNPKFDIKGENGITTTASGRTVTVSLNQNQLATNLAGNGLKKTDDNKLAIKLATDSGLTVGADGLKLASPTSTTTATGITLKTEAASGGEVERTGGVTADGTPDVSTLTAQAGKNIKVTQGSGGVVNIATQDNVEFGNLTATGTTTLSGATTVSGPFTTTGEAKLNGGASVAGRFSTSGNATIGGSLTTTGIANLNGGANLNSKKITKLANGTQDNDAVNLSQLKGVEKTANAANTTADDAAKKAKEAKDAVANAATVADVRTILGAGGTDNNLTAPEGGFGGIAGANDVNTALSDLNTNKLATFTVNANTGSVTVNKDSTQFGIKGTGGITTSVSTDGRDVSIALDTATNNKIDNADKKGDELAKLLGVVAGEGGNLTAPTTTGENPVTGFGGIEGANTVNDALKNLKEGVENAKNAAAGTFFVQQGDGTTASQKATIGLTTDASKGIKFVNGTGTTVSVEAQDGVATVKYDVNVSDLVAKDGGLLTENGKLKLDPTKASKLTLAEGESNLNLSDAQTGTNQVLSMSKTPTFNTATFGTTGAAGTVTVKDAQGNTGVVLGTSGNKGVITLKGEAQNSQTPSTNISVAQGDKTLHITSGNGQKSGNGTRLSYTDGNQTRHVASLDDGLVFTADNTKPNSQEKDKLTRRLSQTGANSNTLNIRGGATGAATTTDNIKVTTDSTGIKVALAKDVQLGNAGTLTAGQNDKQIKLDGNTGKLSVGGDNATQIGKDTITTGGTNPITVNGTDGTVTGLTSGLNGVNGLNGQTGKDALGTIATATAPAEEATQEQTDAANKLSGTAATVGDLGKVAKAAKDGLTTLGNNAVQYAGGKDTTDAKVINLRENTTINNVAGAVSQPKESVTLDNIAALDSNNAVNASDLGKVAKATKDGLYGLDEKITKAQTAAAGKLGEFSITADNTTDGTPKKTVNNNNATFAITGDSNITTTVSDTGVSIALNKELTGLTEVSVGTANKQSVINAGGLTITNTPAGGTAQQAQYGADGVKFTDGNTTTESASPKQGTPVLNQDGLHFADASGSKDTAKPSITKEGISAGDQQITNVKSGLTAKADGTAQDLAGLAKANSTNAANISDLATLAGATQTAITNANTALTNAGIKVGANTGDTATHKLGETLNIKGKKDGNITTSVAQDGDTTNVELELSETAKSSLAKANAAKELFGDLIGDDGTKNIPAVNENGTGGIGNTGKTTVGDAIGEALRQAQTVATNAVQYDTTTGGAVDKTNVSLGGANGTTISNLASGLGGANTLGDIKAIATNANKPGATTDQQAVAKKAVNAGDLSTAVSALDEQIGTVQSTGFKVKGTSGEARTQALGDKTLTFTGKNGIKADVSQTESKDGENTVTISLDPNAALKTNAAEIGGVEKDNGEKDDGRLSVKDKNGNDGVTIAAKDGAGTIGLNGKEGATTNIQVVKDDTKKPLDGTGNGTRLSYTDGDVTRQVASLDDGLKFTADNMADNAKVVVSRKLNETLAIEGGATTSLSDNNIGVVADSASNKLTVKLAKALTGLDSVTAGQNDKQIKLDGNTGKLSVGGENGTQIGKDTITIGGANPITVNGQDGTITGLKGGLNGVDGLNGKNGKDALNAIATATAPAEGATPEQTDAANKLSGTAATVGDLGKVAKAAKDGLDGLGKNLQAQSPVKYVDNNGNAVAYDPETGNYYPAKADGTPDKDKPIPANGLSAKLTGNGEQPITLANVASSIPTTNENVGLGNATPKQFIINLAAAPKNAAATVGDLSRLANVPMTFSGDNVAANFDRKLGEQVKIIGGKTVTTDLTDNNIGVVSNGTDTLTVKLAKDVNLGASGSLTAGAGTTTSVINKDGLTVTAPNPAGGNNQAQYGADGVKFTDGNNTDGNNTAKEGTPVLSQDGLHFAGASGSKDATKPSITKEGIDAGGTAINNIKSGLTPVNAQGTAPATLADIITNTAQNATGNNAINPGNAVNAGDLGQLANAAQNAIVATNDHISAVSYHLGNQITAVDNRLSGEINKVREVLGGNGNHINTEQTVIDNNGQKQTVKRPVSIETIVNADGSTAQVKHTLTTYNVEGQTEYITNDVVQAISKMNNQGIKFFHTNDGKAKPVVQGRNNEDSSASGNYATAIGYQAKASGSSAVALGKGSEANADNTIAIGTGNIVNAANSGAFGDPNHIKATDADNVSVSGSYAIGNNNVINSSNTFVLGSNVNNKGTITDDKPDAIADTVANSVYLGNQTTATSADRVGTQNLKQDGTRGNTTTAGSQGVVRGVVVNNVLYRDFAGARADGVVSVGASGNERRIQNVAAGEISRTSTDAINGSQLYAVADKLGQGISELSAGIASSAAIENAPYVPGKWTYAAGVGHYNNQSAVGVSLRRTADNGRWSFNGGMSTNTQNTPLFHIGVSGVID